MRILDQGQLSLKLNQSFHVKELLIVQYFIYGFESYKIGHEVKLVAIELHDEGLSIVLGDIFAALDNQVPIDPEHLLLSPVSVESQVEFVLHVHYGGYRLLNLGEEQPVP